MTLAKKRCVLLATLTDVNPLAIWQWDFIERVSTGFILKEIGLQDEGTAYLDVAYRLYGVSENF